MLAKNSALKVVKFPLLTS